MTAIFHKWEEMLIHVLKRNLLRLVEQIAIWTFFFGNPSYSLRNSLLDQEAVGREDLPRIRLTRGWTSSRNGTPHSQAFLRT